MELLFTKLNVPRVYPDFLERPRLTAWLNAGTQNKLVIVSAPAGFGKTTLLSSWAAKAGLPVAWLSLDDGDNDPVRFWSYFIAALQTLRFGDCGQNNLGNKALTMLKSREAPPIEWVLSDLINDFAAASTDFVLVLDEYQNITDKSVHGGLTFLIDHLPEQAHIILSGRVDPPLPRSRWRVRHELVQLGTDEIRFTYEEVETFLNSVTGLTLSKDDVSTLHNLTEGWAAALTLAGLSMHGIKDVPAFIKSFAGNNQYVFDYLAQEVLNSQPEEIRRFLLQTSILSRLTSPLCDAVTKGRDGREFLERLEQSRLFIVPLDQRREWYRYHRLFADFLQTKLLSDSEPASIADLHRRASLWHEQHGFIEEAIHHAISSGDYALATRLITNAVQVTFSNGEMITFIKWVDRLPKEVVSQNAEISLYLAWALLATGGTETVELHLLDVERLLGFKAEDFDNSDAGSPLRLAVGQVLCIRANVAHNRNDFPTALKFSKLANSCLSVELGKEYDYARKSFLGTAKFELGLTYEVTGDLAAANGVFTETLALEQESANPHLIPIVSNHLAQISVARGRLNSAEELYKQTLQSLSKSLHPTPLLGLIRTGIGNILCERNDLSQALEYLEQGIEFGKTWNNWETLQPGYFGLARIRAARGETGDAIELLNELMDMGSRLKKPDHRSIVGSYRARLFLRKGDISAAGRWLENTTGLADMDIPYAQEPEALTQAYVLTTLGKTDGSLRISNRLLEVSQCQGRWGRVMEALIIRAMTLLSAGKADLAVDSIAGALKLAEPENYVRIFLDEGQTMFDLLKLVSSRGSGTNYSNHLLNELKVTIGESSSDQTISSFRRQNLALSEPLSEREIEVLQLLARGLTNQQIANQLFLSLNTIKTHVKNVNSKLGTQNRTQATTRAQQLGLLPQ